MWRLSKVAGRLAGYVGASGRWACSCLAIGMQTVGRSTSPGGGRSSSPSPQPTHAGLRAGESWSGFGWGAEEGCVSWVVMYLWGCDAYWNMCSGKMVLVFLESQVAKRSAVYIKSPASFPCWFLIRSLLRSYL